MKREGSGPARSGQGGRGEAPTISHDTETLRPNQRTTGELQLHWTWRPPQKLWKTLRPAATPGGPRQQRRRAGVRVFPPLAGSPGAVAAAAVPKDTSRGQ